MERNDSLSVPAVEDDEKALNEHDVQRGQDLPLTADAAQNNTSNMSNANFNIFGPNFVKFHLERTNIDENVLYGEVNGKTSS